MRNGLQSPFAPQPFKPRALNHVVTILCTKHSCWRSDTDLNCSKGEKIRTCSTYLLLLFFVFFFFKYFTEVTCGRSTDLTSVLSHYRPGRRPDNIYLKPLNQRVELPKAVNCIFVKDRTIRKLQLCLHVTDLPQHDTNREPERSR